MRISGLGFASIRDKDGRYCLLLNRGKIKYNGIRILSPIGGGLGVEPEGMAQLARLGAADFEEGEHGGRDLRFRVPDAEVDQVIRWFGQRIHRETSVLRELTEELTEETSALRKRDLIGMTEHFVGFFQHNGETTRINVAERQTAYLIDVFNVAPGAGAMRKLLAAARLPVAQRWVYFVTWDEMNRRVTDDGVAIGRISRFVAGTDR